LKFAGNEILEWADLLNITIANHLRKKDIVIKSPQKVHEMFKRGIVGEIDMYKNNKTILKFVRPNYEEIEILKLFGEEHIVDKSHLKSMNISITKKELRTDKLEKRV